MLPALGKDQDYLTMTVSSLMSSKHCNIS